MSNVLKPKVVTLEVIYNAIVGLDGRVGKLESRFDGLEKRFDGLEKRFDSLESRMDNLETRMDKLETRMGKLESRMDTLEKKLESSVIDLKNYIDDEISSLAGMVQRGFQEQARMFGLRNSNRRVVA